MSWCTVMPGGVDIVSLGSERTSAKWKRRVDSAGATPSRRKKCRFWRTWRVSVRSRDSWYTSAMERAATRAAVARDGRRGPRSVVLVNVAGPRRTDSPAAIRLEGVALFTVGILDPARFFGGRPCGRRARAIVDSGACCDTLKPRARRRRSSRSTPRRADAVNAHIFFLTRDRARLQLREHRARRTFRSRRAEPPARPRQASRSRESRRRAAQWWARRATAGDAVWRRAARARAVSALVKRASAQAASARRRSARLRRPTAPARDRSSRRASSRRWAATRRDS